MRMRRSMMRSSDEPLPFACNACVREKVQRSCNDWATAQAAPVIARIGDRLDLVAIGVEDEGGVIAWLAGSQFQSFRRQRSEASPLREPMRSAGSAGYCSLRGVAPAWRTLEASGQGSRPKRGASCAGGR
jgi:hypothetical protein